MSINVDFYLREPGNHRKVKTVKMTAVPRRGDFVSFDEEISREVHSVTWLVEKAKQTVQVQLRP